MSDLRLPITPHDIDPAWLNAALTERRPGARVRDVEVLEVHEVTNTHARVRVTYDEAAGAPTTMFCKLPPLDPERRVTIARTDMGRREVLFYARLAPQLSLRSPEVYVALHDDRDGSFVVLMEDLRATGCSVSDGTWGVRPDAAAVALEDLAQLHHRFEDPARRAAEAAWVPRPMRGSTYGTTMLRYGLDNHRDRLSDPFAAIAQIYIDRSDHLQTLWSAGPTTVIHGDPHIGNLFDDRGRTGFLDWGIIHVGTPMRDVSYFLNMALDVHDRRSHERELLAHYLSVRAANGSLPIDFDTAWYAHRLHAAYTVPACCQIVLFPEHISERRRVFAEAFLARAEAAISDLDALGALSQEGF